MNKIPTIKNIMTAAPLTIKGDDNVTNVIQIMKNNNFDHLPVVDDKENLIGIISKSDLYQKALSLSQQTSGKSYTTKVLYVTTASQIMTSDPVFVTTDHSVEFAIELLLQGDFHALPVVADDKLIGIITSKDLLEFIIDEKFMPA